MSLLERTHRVVPASAHDHRLYDGRVVDVSLIGPEVHVTIEPHPHSGGLAGRSNEPPMTVVFSGVTEVNTCRPERLFFSALSECVEQFQTSRFELMNWYQFGDDWDPDLAADRLDVVAESFSD
ncbi:MAG TPA: hypothetical protein VMM78_16805 [Thermomicrobiales bacterium]|nr:hypothetical protein [Thermomicrobiales bacterium]